MTLRLWTAVDAYIHIYIYIYMYKIFALKNNYIEYLTTFTICISGMIAWYAQCHIMESPSYTIALV